MDKVTEMHPALVRLMNLAHELWDDGLDQAAQTIESSCKELSAVIGQPGEQNAAPQADQKGEFGSGDSVDWPSEAPGPAAAAPDVAAMAKRLRGGPHTGSEWAAIADEAAALIEKLGQGWIPPKEK